MEERIEELQAQITELKEFVGVPKPKRKKMKDIGRVFLKLSRNPYPNLKKV